MKTGKTATLLLLFQLSTYALWGQSPKGTITGTITDIQKARIPGVEVAASGLDTAALQRFVISLF